MTLRFLVTRAEPEAARTAERIRALGGDAICAPVLKIEPALKANADVGGAQALLFTSANGLRAFASRAPGRDLVVLCVGDATAEAARAAGFTDAHSADGDGQALAALAARRLDPAAGPLIHISGEDIAFDLAGALAARGFSTERRIFYRAIAAEALPGAVLPLLRAEPPEIDVVLFHSPRGAKVFCALLDSVAPGAFPALIAACLSPAVASVASVSPWRRMIVAPFPREDALLTAAFAQTDAEA